MKEYVSIGNDCSFALVLRDASKRNIAYPFDWLETSISTLPELFLNRFKDFLKNVKTDERKTFYKPFNNPYYFFDSKYKTFHWHDPSICDDRVRQKYYRRCDRLVELLDSKKKEIIFVRIKSFIPHDTKGAKTLLKWIKCNEDVSLEIKQYKLNERLNPNIECDVNALQELSNVIESEYENNKFKILYLVPKQLYELECNDKIIKEQQRSLSRIEIKEYKFDIGDSTDKRVCWYREHIEDENN